MLLFKNKLKAKFNSLDFMDIRYGLFNVLAACLLPFAKLREWQVWGNLNPPPNDGSGSKADF